MTDALRQLRETLFLRMTHWCIMLAIVNAHEWIQTVAGNDTNREIARRSQLSDATLSRQISKNALTFDVVIAVARGYETSVVAALVATGFITAAEAAIDSTESALQVARDEQLVDEVYRRIQRGSSTYDAPVSLPKKRHLAAVSNVGAEHDDEHDDEPGVKQPPAKQRTAAQKGVRKADKVPTAE